MLGQKQTMIQASGLKEFVGHYWTCTKLQYGRLFYNLLQTVLITACCYKRAGVNYQLQYNNRIQNNNQ